MLSLVRDPPGGPNTRKQSQRDAKSASDRLITFEGTAGHRKKASPHHFRFMAASNRVRPLLATHNPPEIYNPGAEDELLQSPGLSWSEGLARRRVASPSR